jgi:hypothetical protein
MSSNKPEIDGFLAMIEAKIAALKVLADSYRAAVAVGALGQSGDFDLQRAPAQSGAAGGSGPVDLPAGVFLGKSMPDAIKLYFSLAKRKQTSKELAAALREGGFESTSRNFEKTVNSTMHRMRETGDLLWFSKDGAFGLAEFYPEGLRNRITQEAKPKAKKRAKGKKRAAKANNEPAPVAVKPEAGATIDQRIVAVLREGPRSPAELVARLGAQSNVVGLALGRLTFKGKVSKSPEGIYGLAESEPFLRVV